MNKELYYELQDLMKRKEEYQIFLSALKNKPRINKIELAKGLYNIYFQDDLIVILINYYENELKHIEERINCFKLLKSESAIYE